MNEHFNQISRYFRQSLIDADRLCPQDKDILPVLSEGRQQDPSAEYFALDKTVWQRGRIESALAEQILNARQPKNQPPLQQLEIVIFPRVDFLGYQGGAIDRRKRNVLLPLVVFVNLQRDGNLKPSDKMPWIPRIWIGPTQSANEPFTEMALLDTFLTQHPFEGVENWSQLTSYCTKLLCFATGTSYQEGKEQQHTTQINNISLLSDYHQSEQCLFQLDAPVVGAKVNLLKVLDYLIEKNQYPKLYKSYSQCQDAQLQTFVEQQNDIHLAKQHLGQMSGEFPLAIKQRNALHYSMLQAEGEILAVNGPPGTGKTTLLRSVVANLWTQAALAQGEAPLIVATSNNNQAVTNILESFARIDESGLEETLQGRWIPEVDSYGLYFCASNKANNANPYRYSGPKGEGCMEGWQTQTFIKRAKEYFLGKVSQWQKSPCDDLNRALSTIHAAMLRTKQQLHLGLDCLAEWQSALAAIKQQHGSIEGLSGKIDAIKASVEAQTQQYNHEKSLLDAVYGLWESRSWWIRLLIWLPSLRRQEERKTARLLNQWDRPLNVSSDEAVEATLNQMLTDIRSKLTQRRNQLAQYENCLEQFNLLQDRLNTWLQPGQHIGINGDSIPKQVLEVADRIYRFRLFKLATHYFEGRWLKETKTFVESKDEDKKSPFKLLRKLRRYAKLTPCFVSTFYMVPNAFMAGEYKDSAWMDLPQLEEIDLLIIDEAGQALSDVSAASFALAKKALIVGDTDQIEPVWSIPASVDRSNLTLFNLLRDEEDYQKWLDSGLLASSGNVMAIAQRQSHYHQFTKLQRGLYLTEHRRCYKDIINYCNDLVYEELLEPKREGPDQPVPWGMMTFQTTSSPSSTYGGSRGNLGEARAIAQWVTQEVDAITRYARQQEEKYHAMDVLEILKETVGIITPFSKQAQLIRQELKKSGIEGLTVGTVHSLQGDERLIVLFSSVYGENDRDSAKFYDTGPNMLNVAVSRAKDAFIVFGDPNVFGVTNQGSPSGLLRQRLSTIDNAQTPQKLEESY